MFLEPLLKKNKIGYIYIIKKQKRVAKENIKFDFFFFLIPKVSPIHFLDKMEKIALKIPP